MATIEDRTVILHDLYTEDLITREDIDNVILVVGAKAEDGLFGQLEPLRQKGVDLHMIGDALAPRRVNDAIREGERLARKL